jgi:hypothetical protein
LESRNGTHRRDSSGAAGPASCIAGSLARASWREAMKPVSVATTKMPA